jgi:hypothetical protein
LGVDAEREPLVGVTEPGLSRLEVDACEDESGGVGPAEVVAKAIVLADTSMAVTWCSGW